MMRGDLAGGERIWSGMSQTMLYRADQPALHQSFEYLDGNTGLAMGAFPFGGDGACFMVASLGASEWAWDEVDGAFRLTLRAAALQPAAGLTLLRPLGGRALAGGVEGENEEGGSDGGGGGATAFVRLSFGDAFSLLADVVDGAVPAGVAAGAGAAAAGAAPAAGAGRGTGRHEWRAKAGAHCTSSSSSSSSAAAASAADAPSSWRVECTLRANAPPLVVIVTAEPVGGKQF